MNADPVWASLTGAETALASMAGMKTVASSVAWHCRRGLNKTTRDSVSYQIAHAWDYHKLCLGT